MKILNISTLKEGTYIKYPLYFKHGGLLLKGDTRISLEQINAIQRAGIMEVFECESDLESKMLKQGVRGKMIMLSDLHIGNKLRKAIYHENGGLLLAKDHIVTKELIEQFKRKRIIFVYEELSIGDIVEKDMGKKEEKEVFDPLIESESLKKIDQELLEEVSDEIICAGEPLEDLLGKNKRKWETEEIKQEFQSIRDKTVDKTSEILDMLKNGNGLDIEETQKVVDDIIDKLVKNKNLLLAVNSLKTPNNYILGHSINVCTLSISVGTTLGYARKQILELGIGALLHDIGMLKVPYEIAFKPGQLTPDEFFEI